MYLPTKGTFLKKKINKGQTCPSICGKICIYLLRVHTFDGVNAIFSDILYKSICWGYSFELHRQVDAIQMGTHNICLNKEVDKK